jgi:PPOX class probable F420-dependent enzyme
MSDQTTVPEAFTDLLDAPLATLATIGPDGRPQLSAVWFLHDGGEVKVSLHETRQKTKNLRTKPAVNLFVLDPQNPLRYLEIRGDAELVDDPDYAFADKVGAKYGGADLRQMDGDDQRRVVATIRSARVVAIDLGA